MSFKQINVKLYTSKKVKKLSKKFDIKIYELIDVIVSFFYENQNIINADFFQKSNSLGSEEFKYKLDKRLETIIKREINRLIGFIKVQDKFMKSMKKDILFTTINNEEFKLDYHPLFNDYEYQIYIYKKILGDFGIKTENEILEYIEKNQGSSVLNDFLESYEKTKQKKIVL